MMMSDLEGCVVTLEQTQRKLEAIERSLGEQLGIVGSVRTELIAREMRGELEHSSLVADWQQTYVSFRDWMAEEAEDWSVGDPVMGDMPPPPLERRREGQCDEGAANDAAFSLLYMAKLRSSNRVSPSAARLETAAISRSLLSRVDCGN